jgi:hypothetical protein
MLAAQGFGGGAMQDMETDLMAFDDFFNSATDEIDDGKTSSHHSLALR